MATACSMPKATSMKISFLALAAGVAATPAFAAVHGGIRFEW